MAYTSIAIVGAGPRGTSCLERLCASAREILRGSGHLTIHIIDPYPPGPGKVWRTDQPPRLLMNTITSQVSLFTDPSVQCDGPNEPGPTLHQWSEGECWLNWGPNDYSTRFAHGRYLEWVFGEICRRAAAIEEVNVTILKHSASATKLEEDPLSKRQSLTLDTGERLTGLSAVILAQGHLPARLDDEQTYLTNFSAANKVRGLRYFPPNNPVDSRLDDIAPGEVVFLRGLGLDFFDYLILLTSRRGGRFIPRNGGGFTYSRSGTEPIIYAGSRRGLPYHARGDNERDPASRHRPHFLTPQVIDGFKERTRTAVAGNLPRFKEEIWPYISKEVKKVYYETLLRSKGLATTQEFRDFLTRQMSHRDNDEAEITKVRNLGLTNEDVWSWERLKKPQANQVFDNLNGWNIWLKGHLEQDVEYAKAGNVRGPLKAALDVMRDIRNEVRLIVDHRGVDGTSYRDDLVMRYTSLNSFLSVGPPRRRIEEMIALMEAGVLQVLGPDVTVRCRGNEWFAESVNPSCSVKVQTIIEARIPPPSLQRTEDPLLKNLLKAKQCRPHKIGDYETGGIDITERPYNVIDANSNINPRRFAIGVPTEGVHWATTAGVRPWVNSVNLTDSDAVARAALRCAATDAPRPAANQANRTVVHISVGTPSINTAS